ncbi:unnamed protein product, partial [Prorocentrum cordatum]
EQEPQPAPHTRLYEYIPLYLTGSTRAQEITREHYMGEILFPGMSRRPTLDGRHRLFQHDYHWELSFGWTYKSFGGSIFLHQRFRQAHLRDPGYDHDGACGQSSHALQRGGPQLGDSVDETFLGSSSLLVPDLRSEVDSAVGTFLELEGPSGRLWQRFLSDHDTFFVSGDTFIGTHGRRLNILYDRDHRSFYAGDIFKAHALHTWDYDAIRLRREGALKTRDLQQAVTFLPKTVRLHAQLLRDLADSEWISIVTTPTATTIVAAREAGKMYAEAA